MEKSLQQLFERYLNGNTSRGELNALMAYFNMPENEQLLKQLIIRKLEDRKLPEIDIPELDTRLEVIQKNIQAAMHHDSRLKWRVSWKYAAAAAVITLTVSVGLFRYLNKNDGKLIAGNIASKIKPGKYTATLTLANGRKIILSTRSNGGPIKQPGAIITKITNGRIAYKAIGTPSKMNDGADFNTIGTANGEQYQVILPDGSLVTLNAASSLTYPVSFTGLKERKVVLTGEAYFVVKHNAGQPFKVISKSQEVEDIGTEFNINCYDDESSVKTTLVTGSAKVSMLVPKAKAPPGNTTLILVPDQQALLTGNVLVANYVDVNVSTAWRNGEFAYHNTSLQEVMRQAARWYNIQIVYEQDDLKSKRLTGSISRYENLSGMLSAIAYTAKIRFKIEGRKITVIKNE